MDLVVPDEVVYPEGDEREAQPRSDRVPPLHSRTHYDGPSEVGRTLLRRGRIVRVTGSRHEHRIRLGHHGTVFPGARQERHRWHVRSDLAYTPSPVTTHSGDKCSVGQ